MQIINRLTGERYMKKNISLLTFSVQNVNSSYWEPHSSFNANSKSLKVDQDSFTWMIIFCFVITCLLDNVLALWWKIRSWPLSGYKGVSKQTRKTTLILFIVWLAPWAGKMNNILRWLVTRAGKMVLSSSRTVKVNWLGLNGLWISFLPTITFLGQLDEKFTSFSGLGW